MTDTLIESLQWRYATKKFDPDRKIPDDVWAGLEKAAILSPSSYGLQPYKLVVVTDPDTRKRLRPAAFDQAQITDSSHLVVFSARTDLDLDYVDRFITRASELRHVPKEQLADYQGRINGFILKPPLNLVDWGARQAYLALGIFLAAAANARVDACPMEGFVPSRFDEILGLKAQHLQSVVLATAGYRAGTDPYAGAPKVRWNRNELIQDV
ncbi:MAG TPA: NAD(P)H-dependent oxidoreductase [Chthoniobacterales bacterium]